MFALRRPGVDGEFEAIELPRSETLAGMPLDLLQLAHFIGGYEGDGIAGRQSAARSADSMDVVLGLIGRVEVDHMRNAVHIYTASSDIGGDHDLKLAAFKATEGTLPLVLRSVRVEDGGTEATLPEFPLDAVGPVLGAGKNQHVVHRLRLEQMNQQVHFLGLRDHAHVLVDRLGRVASMADLDHFRPVHDRLGEGVDLRRHRGREEQCLPPPGYGRDDFADVGEKAHVEHPVGFIQHEEFDVREIEAPAVEMVEQPAWCGDNDVDAPPKAVQLRMDPDAAENGEAPKTGMFAIGSNRFFDLKRQLTRRSDDQGPDGAALSRASHHPGEHG